MKFFIPDAKDDVSAKKLYEGIVKFIEEKLRYKINNRRIYEITYTHDRTTHTSRVGENEDKKFGGKPVIAILESENLYLICTPHNGVFRGDPQMVGKNDTFNVEDFDN